MPTSEPLQPPAASVAVRRTLAAAAVVLTATTVVTVVSDPYGLFGWRGRDPNNGVLDAKMRFVKTLRAYGLEAPLVFVGSSTVYRGLDPAHALTPAYNFGVSGMRVTEMEGYARLLAERTRPKTVVLALDFFMFDAVRQSEPGYEPRAAQPLTQAELLGRALWSGSALYDSALAWHTRGRDSADGAWTDAGYKRTNRRSAPDVAWILGNTRREYQAMRYDAALFSRLAAAISALRSAGADVKVMLSPVNATFHRVMDETGQAAAFTAYRAQAARVAAGAGAQFFDFTDFAPPSDLSGGSDEAFIDVTHYQPEVGRRMLASMGLARP